MLKKIGIILTILLGFFMFSVGQSFAEFDFENITGLWLFDNGEGTTAADTTGNGMMAQSMVHLGLMENLGRHSNLTEPMTGLKWLIPIMLHLKREHHFQSPFTSKELKLQVLLLVKTMRTNPKQHLGIYYGTVVETIR